MARAPGVVESILKEIDGQPLESYRDFVVMTEDNELIASISHKDGNAIVKNGYKVSGYDKA